MQKRKFIINVCIILNLLLLINILFVIKVFAIKYDEDLSNLSATTSVTLKIGDNDYTINNDTDVEGLISLDMAILEYKANNGTTDYTKVYNQLLKLLEKNATTITGNIAEQTIAGDTIWKIDDTVNMNGNITISSTGRLVMIGSGTIQKGGNYSIKLYGYGIFQDNIYFDGNSINADMLVLYGGKTYFSDEFHIGNTKTVGIRVKEGQFYMLGGLIGTTDIDFNWLNENDEELGKKDYLQTINYIDKQINSSSYEYINAIESNGGCEANGILVESGGNFKMHDGIIAGNKSSAIKSYGNAEISNGLIIGNVSDWGGAISDSGSAFKISGGKIMANFATGYGGAITSGYNTIIEGNAILAYNSSMYNGGAIVINGARKTSISNNALLTHNTAVGTYRNDATGSGNGGCIRTVGTLEITGGTISYNYANGRKEYCPDYLNSGNGGAISGQTDGSTRIADIKLISGNIINNKSREDGGGIFLTCYYSEKQATFRLNGTNISNNTSGNNGGAVYLSAKSGTLVADIISGTVSNNSSQNNGGGLYLELGKHVNQMAKSLIVNIGEEDNSKLSILNNTALKIGGAIYIDRTLENTSTDNTININLYSGILRGNSANNGGAIGISKGNFNVYGAVVENNNALIAGGGIYQTGGNVSISGGTISNNNALSMGGGIYLSDSNMVMNDGNVQYNKSTNGNGGGIYLDNNSNFKFINGKVVYNSVTSTETPTKGTLAKESTSGVGGGVYINSGVFSMYDDNNNAGTGAIYGNTADYSADDLFATGENTQFDAISVIEMKKADEYMTSDSWFEDYPEEEEHLSLNEENRINIKSKGRYKTLENNDLVDDMVVATTVLKRNCTDYIAITMGKGVGGISLEVNDTNVQSDQTFIYKLEYVKVDDSDTGELSMILSTDSSGETVVNKIPAGTYKLTLIPSWSWRYKDKANVKITSNNITKEMETEEFEVNVYSNQITKCVTSYSLKTNNEFMTKLLNILKGVK